MRFFNLFRKTYHYFRTSYIILSIQNIGEGNYFDDNITIHRPENLKIGSDNYFGKNTLLIAHGSIELGNTIAIAADCKFITRNHIYKDKDTPIADQDYQYKPIKIGDNCWFGYNVIVLPGVTLGKSCIIAAGSVVTKSFQDYSVIAGVPAKFIKQNI
tara:strand:- start:1253 stop:1723 length:471 start_codon:yes stop_codon:yes gene_type:complete